MEIEKEKSAPKTGLTHLVPADSADFEIHADSAKNKLHNFISDLSA